MKFLLLYLFIFGAYLFAQEIAYTSFEEPEVFPGMYTDTTTTTEAHPLLNIENQPILNYVASGGELGFNSYYYNTRNSAGLTDGDFVGVTNSTSNVGSFTDGSNGFEISDADGYMVTTLDTVYISDYNSVLVTLDYFVAATGWEGNEVLRIWLVVDDTINIDLLNTKDMDINDLEIEGAWNTLSKKITGYNKLNIRFGLDSDAATEYLYIDNIHIYNGDSLNISPILEEYTTSKMPPLSDSTFSVIYKAYDVDGYISNMLLHYTINSGDTIDVDMSAMAVDSLYRGEITNTAYKDEDLVEYWVTAVDDSGAITISDIHGFFAGKTSIISFKQWIGDSKLLYENYYVRTAGVATVGDSVFSNSSMHFYIQDEEYSAVKIYNPTGGSVDIVPGHRYTVTGVITQYRGVIEVIPDEPRTDVIDEGEAEMPIPIILVMATLLSGGELYESVLFKIENVDTIASDNDDPWPINNDKYADIIISDDGGTNQMILHLDEYTDIPGKSQPIWPQHITGIFGQYDDSAPYTEGYRLMPRSFNDFETPTEIEDLTTFIPEDLILYPAYPNPFNPATTIPFNIPVDMVGEQDKKLTIYNTLGQVIKEYTLSNVKTGLNTVIWNGRSDDGRPVTSGLYFAVLQVNNLRHSTKLLLLK